MRTELQRNKRGDRLVEFMPEKKMVVINTVSRLPMLIIWKSPQDRDEKIKTSDTHSTSKKFWKRYPPGSAKVHPGNDITSDHNPVAIFSETFRKLQNTQKKSSTDISKFSKKDAKLNAKNMNETLRILKGDNRKKKE